MRKCSIFLSILLTLLWSVSGHTAVQWQVLSPVTFTRGTGKPVTEIFTFMALGGTATLKLTNGTLADTTGEKVSSSLIKLNDTLLCSPSEFNQTVTSIEKQITLMDGSNRLEVTLMGKPGGQVTLEVLAETAEITPEISIVQTANALRAGDIDLVLKGFEQRELTTSAIQSLDTEKRYQLALWIENAELIKETDSRRVYRYTWPDGFGEKYSDFTMVRNEEGKWIISNW